MSKVLTLVLVIMCSVVSVPGQSENDLKRQFESREAKASSFIRTSYPEVRARPTRRGVVQLGPRTTYLKVGLSTEEVLRVLGQPAVILERREDGIVVTTYEFTRGDGRVLVAEFVGGSLVRTKTETRVGAERVGGPVA